MSSGNDQEVNLCLQQHPTRILALPALPITVDTTLADEFPSQDNILALTKMELPFFKVVSKLICTSSILLIVTPVEDELRSLTHALYGCAPEVEYRSWADADARLSRWIVRLFDYP